MPFVEVIGMGVTIVMLAIVSALVLAVIVSIGRITILVLTGILRSLL